MESENQLKESLIVCDREKEALEMKCSVLESEKTGQSQTVKYEKDCLITMFWFMVFIICL